MANNKTAVRQILDKVKAEGRTSLTAPEGKLVCDAYGIAVPKEGVATSAAEAAKLAAGMGFPVVLKIVSPEILHKTEAGGVLVGVKSADEVDKGFATIMANAKKYDAKAKLLGVQVQQMLAGGQEVIIGAVTDPSFGKLVAFGLGGILVEVLKDITFRLAPATRDDALSMLDGIAAAEILKGVRGADPVDRDALAALIQNVSQLVADFPEIAEMDLNPVFATQERRDRRRRAHRRRFRARRRARFRPSHDDIVRDMNRIMKPDAVAVIGASSEEGKIGNSVMKNLINGGYKGEIYPINPVRRRDHGAQGVQERQGRAGQDRRRGVRDSREVRRAGADRGGREEDPRRRADPVGLRRDRQRRGPEGDPGHRPQVRRAPDGPEHLRLLLHVEEPLRDVLHRVRRQGPRRAVVAVGRHRHGDHRLLALGQDGRVGDRGPGQQVRHRRGRSADVLRAGRQHDDHRAALRGSEGRPRVRRGREARVEEEAHRHAQGRPHQHGRARRELAHRRARRQRQDLRGRAQAVGRDPRAAPARPARVRARDSDPAHAQGRERRSSSPAPAAPACCCPTPASTTGCR